MEHQKILNSLNEPNNSKFVWLENRTLPMINQMQIMM